MSYTAELKAKIIRDNYSTTRTDALALLKEPLEELAAAANDIRRHFCGDDFDMCTIVNAKCGRCSENCRYCAQSVHYKTASKEYYTLLGTEEILKAAKHDADRGVPRFSLVTAGRTLSQEDVDQVCEEIRAIR